MRVTPLKCTAAIAVFTGTMGLFAGFCLAFTNVALPGLRLVEPAVFTQAMQAMASTGQNPIYALVVLGPAPCIAFTMMGLLRRIGSLTFMVTLAAALLYGAALLLTITATMPLNLEILEWDMANPPAEAVLVRDRLIELNMSRTAYTISAFFCGLASLLLHQHDARGARPTVHAESY